MDVLFFNDTEIEKVASYAAFSDGRRGGSAKLAARAAMAMSFLMVLLFITPIKTNVKVFSCAALGVGIISMIILLIRKKDRSTTGTTADMGFVPTGDKQAYRYEFGLDGFTVRSDETREMSYSEIISVRDIGGAFQMKTSAASYTLKKSGFSDGGAK